MGPQEIQLDTKLKLNFHWRYLQVQAWLALPAKPCKALHGSPGEPVQNLQSLQKPGRVRLSSPRHMQFLPAFFILPILHWLSIWLQMIFFSSKDGRWRWEGKNLSCLRQFQIRNLAKEIKSLDALIYQLYDKYKLVVIYHSTRALYDLFKFSLNSSIILIL